MGFLHGLGSLGLLTPFPFLMIFGVKGFCRSWKNRLRLWLGVLLLKSRIILPVSSRREPQAPEVLELQMKVLVRLAPQKWLPCGKAWLKLNNAGQFKPGDQLDGDLRVKVVAVQEPYISVSAAISRKTAASLFKCWVEADPSVWAPHFLEQWNTYWKRDTIDDLPAGSQEFLGLVAQIDPVPPMTMGYDLWHRVLRSAKSNSMRGVDGWSFAELRLVP